jgi:hypothetical protein
MSRWFSDRHGYSARSAEIIIREDAPEELRYMVAHIARMVGMTPSAIRNVVCEVLFVAPDRDNWSDPNMWDEVQALLRTCEWVKVYDVAETLWRNLEEWPDDQLRYQDELNRLFREKGIGWELKDGIGIVYRGEEPFEAATSEATKILAETGRTTAAGELREALSDLSRRPNPDVSGAIQHAIAALECVARDIARDRKRTLGELIPKLGLPRPLDEAVIKLWGYASERARHRREGEAVSDDEAEMVVSVAAAVSTFLAKRART